MNSSEYTLSEIMAQHTALEHTLQKMRKKPIDQGTKPSVHIFTGCGTSFYLAHAAAKYFQKVTGELAIAVPSSEIFMNEKTVISDQYSYRVVAISRSGTTSEVLKAIEHLKDHNNCDVLAVTCNGDSEMLSFSTQAIVLDFIQEKSVVMTQSFSCMLYALQLYAAQYNTNAILLESLAAVPSVTRAVLERKDEIRQLIDEQADRFIYLGADIFNGLAKEATLKLKEMTQTECESYSNLEFRHGPISTVDNKTIVILLSSDSTERYDQSLITDIQAKGGKVIVIAKEGSTLQSDQVIEIPTGQGSEEAAPAFMPFLQLLAYYKAISLNLDPDQPRNLTQVVEISI